MISREKTEAFLLRSKAKQACHLPSLLLFATVLEVSGSRQGTERNTNIKEMTQSISTCRRCDSVSLSIYIYSTIKVAPGNCWM